MKRAKMIDLRLTAGLLLALLLLSACAVRPPEPVATEPVAAEEEPATAAAAEPEVERRGFVIDEPHELSAEEQGVFYQAVILLGEGRVQDAIALLETLVKNEPPLSAFYINLGKAYRQIGDKEKAETALKQAMELIPGHPLASQEYGLLLRTTGRFAEARAVYAESLELYPDYLPLRKNLGILCDIYLNDTACALEQFEYIQELQPNDKIKLWISEIKLR